MGCFFGKRGNRCNCRNRCPANCNAAGLRRRTVSQSQQSANSLPCPLWCPPKATIGHKNLPRPLRGLGGSGGRGRGLRTLSLWGKSGSPIPYLRYVAKLKVREAAWGGQPLCVSVGSFPEIRFSAARTRVGQSTGHHGPRRNGEALNRDRTRAATPPRRD
jgi:hypothetical protein